MWFSTRVEIFTWLILEIIEFSFGLLVHHQVLHLPAHQVGANYYHSIIRDEREQIYINMFYLAGIASALNNQFYLPYSLVRDSSTGTLYISDSGNNRVMRYFSGATSGTIIAGSGVAGFSATQLYFPTGIYLDSSSNSLIITNYGANNIVRWIIGATSLILLAGSPNGTPRSTSTLLYAPMDVTLDPMGNIYVADAGNHRIQFFVAG
jgi:DNA-binding beta-propeller fold protein YncE